MANQEWRSRGSERKQIDDLFDKVTNWLIDYTKNLTLEEASRRLDDLENSDGWTDWSNLAAQHIITTQAKQNARTWKEAARKSRNGSKIFKLLNSELKANEQYSDAIQLSAGYIKTLPKDIADKLVKRTAELATQGIRYKSGAKQISEMIKGYTKASSTLLARTQIAKTLSMITQQRSERLGIYWYTWYTVGGPRVRESHKHMNGVVCSYRNPPNPEQLAKKPGTSHYNPGGIYNCRCYAEPVVDIEDLTFPIRIVYNGRIRTMSKRKFMEIQNV